MFDQDLLEEALALGFTVIRVLKQAREIAFWLLLDLPSEPSFSFYSVYASWVCYF